MSTESTASTGAREIETDGPPSRAASPAAPIRKANHIFAALALFIGFVILAGLIAVLWESARQNRPAANETALASGNPLVVPGPSSATTLPEEQAAAQSSGTAAQATVKLLALRTIASEAKAEMEKLQAEVASWKSVSAEIEGGTAGKRIAGSDLLVDRLLLVLDRDRPKESAVESLKQQLDVLTAPIDEAFRSGNGGFSPEPSYAADLERIASDAKKACAAFRTDRETLEFLTRESAAEMPSDIPLTKRLEDRRLAHVEERLKAIEAATKAAKEEAVRLVSAAETEAIQKKAAAEAEAAKILGESESKRLIADAELRRKTLDEEFARRKLAEEAANLRKRAEDPAVQRQYSAFLDKEFRRFNSHPKSAFLDKSPEREPVSWNDLNANGWMEDVKSFARALCPSRWPCISMSPMTVEPCLIPRPKRNGSSGKRCLKSSSSLGRSGWR